MRKDRKQKTIRCFSKEEAQGKGVKVPFGDWWENERNSRNQERGGNLEGKKGFAAKKGKK